MVSIVTAGLMSASLLTSDVNAQNQTKQQITSQPAKLAAKSPVMSLIITSKEMIAVGVRGHVLFGQGLAEQGSTNWHQKIVPTNVLLTSVTFTDENNGWVVGHDATIIHTGDGGDSWQTQQYLPALDRPLLDVTFINEKTGFAVGAYGMFFGTNDGGASWTKQFLASLLPVDDVEYLNEIRGESEEDYQAEISSILPHFNKIIELSDKRLMLVGELGLIAFSNDQGKTWVREHNIYEGSFFSASQTNKNTLLVGGLRGHVFRSNDNGVSWSQISLVNSNSVNDISQLSNGDIYIAQNNGVALKSVDDGLSFTQVSLLKGQDLMAIQEFNQQIWVAGSKGLNRFQEVK
jgi:photosystem II stability/assembly factor-like uncharacterized protein